MTKTTEDKHLDKVIIYGRIFANKDLQIQLIKDCAELEQQLKDLEKDEEQLCLQFPESAQL
tara:strand:+ start:1124 stop:1306 length:183 start_codon:yes stop_codon:yes gene_type:complete